MLSLDVNAWWIDDLFTNYSYIRYEYYFNNWSNGGSDRSRQGWVGNVDNGTTL